MKRNIVYLVILAASIIVNVFFVFHSIQMRKHDELVEWIEQCIIDNRDSQLLNDLIERSGEETSLPYALYLADVANDGYGCDLVYLLIESFYHRRDMRIPEQTYHMLIPYLQKGAELNDFGCLVEMIKLLKEGRYIQKDTNKILEYERILSESSNF